MLLYNLVYSRMGNICQQKIEHPVLYQSGMKQISSYISQHQEVEVPQILQMVTLTSQNTQSSFNLEEGSCLKNKSEKVKNIEDFKIIRPLGKGAFGEVLLTQDKINQKYYALKIINKDTIKNNQQKNHAMSERYLLQALDFPFIVKLHYAFQSKNKLYLLVDFMAGGQLFYLLREKQIFEEEVAKFYAAQILLALEYLHSRNIIYRDLKPQNVLLTKEGHIKLADFGLSKICFSRNQLAYSICGTPEYIAPQIILGKGYDQSVDWFSFGSLLYDMLTGKPPFYSKNKHQILSNITSKEVPLPEHLSPAARNLLRGLFKIKAKERLGLNGADQIKQHQFFSNVDFQKLKKLQVKPPIDFVNFEINLEGFDQNNESFGSSNFELNIQEGSKIPSDGFFKDFTYYKQQTYSYSNKQSEGKQIINPSNFRFNINRPNSSQNLEKKSRFKPNS